MNEIREHYDGFSEEYLRTYGAVIQSARPFNLDKLLAHEFESAQIEPGMLVLDAGCGFGGPALYFAERDPTIHVYGITISPIQQKLSLSRKNLTIQCGDYHKLSHYYPQETFDRVLFLESLCHSQSRQIVLKETWNVLKRGGGLYIKDYFRLNFDEDEKKKQIQDTYYERMEQDYHVRFIPVSELVVLLVSIGFHVEFVRSLPDSLVSDYDTAIEFERMAKLTWREGLPFPTSESVEIFCTKPF